MVPPTAHVHGCAAEAGGARSASARDRDRRDHGAAQALVPLRPVLGIPEALPHAHDPVDGLAVWVPDGFAVRHASVESQGRQVPRAHIP